MEDPWGVDEPAATTRQPPLPPGLAAHAEVVRTGERLRVDGDYVEPEELPEVQALIDEGWIRLSDAPSEYLVAAFWPSAYRCWVADRTPHTWDPGRSTSDYYRWIRPRETSGPWAWSRDEDVDAEARSAGLPPAPRGRVWLVRSPWPGIHTGDVLRLITHRADDRRRMGAPDYYRTGCDVVTMSRERVADAIRRELHVDPGRPVGADQVGRLLDEWDIPWADFERWRDEAGLTPDAMIAWMSSADVFDGDIVDLVRGWRRYGLPGDPPSDAADFVDHDLAEVRRFLDAGFSLYDAGMLEYVGVDRAIAWRDAGFSAQDTYELLRCDPDLATDQARAFDDPAVRADRRDWIYYGFSAVDATAWSAAGVSPERARLWRATGHVPADLPAQIDGNWLLRVPPELRPSPGSYVGTVVMGDGEPEMNGWAELPDPPGTRGRFARRMRGDRHPWIQTD